MSAPNPPKPTASDPQSSQHTQHISIALSTIIASIWAGIWGFDWAASHLSGGGLFVAILIGLLFGTVLTIYTLDQSFKLMREAINKPGDGAVLGQT